MPVIPTPKLHLQRFSEPQFATIAPTLLDIYAEIYADILIQPFNSVAAFYQRLCSYSSRPGWECVMASYDGQPVGYAFGHPLSAESSWWQGLLTSVQPDAIRETGHRTFALNEIMVRQAWRGTTTARTIHDELIHGRPEARVTLLVDQTHTKVRQHYELWGYRWFAALQPVIPHAPIFDALILPIHACHPQSARPRRQAAATTRAIPQWPSRADMGHSPP